MLICMLSLQIKIKNNDWIRWISMMLIWTEILYNIKQWSYQCLKKTLLTNNQWLPHYDTDINTLQIFYHTATSGLPFLSNRQMHFYINLVLNYRARYSILQKCHGDDVLCCLQCLSWIMYYSSTVLCNLF